MTEPETIDIVALVKNNPLTRLTSDYGSKIIQKIQQKFNSGDQQMFVANFYCYLNYDQKNDFVIDLDRIWKWLGYTRMDNCKSVLIKHFKENEDYTIEKAAPEDTGAAFLGGAGMNKEFTSMTIKCFKKLCLKSRTEKSDQIHEYYINLEEMMNELVDEQTTELRNKLSIKDQESKSLKEQLALKDQQIGNTSFKNQQDLLLKHSKKRGLYIISVENVAKFGITIDINSRFITHKNEISENIVLMYFLETVYNQVIEKKIKDLCQDKNDILYKKRIEKIYNDKIQTELIQLSDEFPIEQLWNKVLQIEKSINKDELFSDLEHRIEILENENAQLRKNPLEIVRVKEVKLMCDEGTFPILVYNIIEKTTTKIDTLHEAKKILDVDILTIKNYINNKKHMSGNVLRSDTDKPYWMPPENFKFCNFVKRSFQTVNIKRINKLSGEITYFNSITEASLYLQQELDQKEIVGETEDSILLKKALGDLIRNIPTRKQILNKYHWFKMKEIGFIVSMDGTRTCIDENESDWSETIIRPVNSNVTGPIIVRNLDTLEEIIHESGFSSTEFYKKYGMRRETFDKFINEPQNYKNYTFRTVDMPYWNPPATYMRNEQQDNARVNYFLKVTNNLTKHTTYHHSITDMAISLFPNDDKINITKSITKKISGGSNPTRLVNYNIVKLEKCGQFVYQDGKIIELENNHSI